MMFTIAGVILFLLVVLPACIAYSIAIAPMFSMKPTIQEVNPTQLINMDSQMALSFAKRNEKQMGDELVTALCFFRHDKENEAFLAEYAKFAADMEGLVRPLAINCNKWETFCKENRVHLTPVVKMYVSGTGLAAGLPYLGNGGAATLAKVVNKLIPDGIVELLDSKRSIDNFFNSGKSTVKVVLYSSKTSVPLMLKALANEPNFRHNVKFGFATERSPRIVPGLKVSKFPTLISLNDEAQHTLYDGEFKYTAMKSWMSGLLANLPHHIAPDQEAL
jgi:hypothetical protein